jgi:hypothetical protein
VFAAGLATVSLGATLVLRAAPLLTDSPDHAGLALPRYSVIPYEPVCQRGTPTVCVHPAFEELLPGVAARIGELAAPLAGVPGAPTRAEQLPRDSWDTAPDSVLPFDLYGTYSEPRTEYFAANIALGLARPGGPGRLLSPRDPSAGAWDALAIWLLQRLGETVDPMMFSRDADSYRVSLAAAERFGRLSPERQRAWLERNYAALRAGKVTLEDMP